MQISTSVDVDVDINVDEKDMIEALESAGYIVSKDDDLVEHYFEMLSYYLISLARTHNNPSVRDAYLHAAQMVMERSQ